MKRFLSMLLVCCMLFALLPAAMLTASAATYSGICGKAPNYSQLRWTLDSDTGVLYVHGSGAMGDFKTSPNNEPWFPYSSYIKSVTFSEDVPNIGENAFYDCENLSFAVIPGNVKDIGSCAFYLCRALTDVKIEDGVETIGSWAFYCCLPLKSASIPSSVSSIGNGAFKYCNGMTSLTILNPICDIYNDPTTLGVAGTTTIYGFKGSTAQSYAKEYGYTFVEINDSSTPVDKPIGNEYELTTSLRDGDEVVIYNASAGKAMSEDAIDTYNTYRAGVDVTVSNNMIVTNDSKIIWKVKTSGSGFTFANDVGETLSATKGLSFAATDNVWAINPATTASGVYIVSTTATGIQGDPKLIQWYDKYSEFTTWYYYDYSKEAEATFVMQLFVKKGNAVTVTPSDIPTEPTTAPTEPTEPVEPVVSSEIIHLIFADMAYQLFKKSDEGKTVYQFVVNEQHGSLDPLYKGSSFCQRDAFRLVGDWKIKEVDYGDAQNEAAGYASVAFQKGNQIIIAYRGSEDGPLSIFTEDADWDVDIQFALYNYLNPAQFEAALKTYNKLARESSNITLTGHSLGGALATYVSTITGKKAYTYDGADGHVVDLSYYVGFREIDFHGKEEMNFVNYTDAPSPKNRLADLIQAMNTEYYYGNYYKYNADHIHPGGYWAVPAHFIYSTTQLSSDGKTIEFTDLVQAKEPKANWKMTFKNGFSFSDYTDSEISRLTTHVTITLGTTNADRLKGTPSEIIVPKRLKTMKNVIYGGDGADNLIGSGDSTIFIPGKLEGDHLTGGMGSDLYYLDCQNGGDVYISDQSGYDIIQLKNVDGFTSAGAVYQGKVDGWHLFTIGGIVNVYIKEKGAFHWYSVLSPTGTEICRLSAKNGVITIGGGGGGRGIEATMSENDCKEVSIDGDVTIRIINSNSELIDTFSSSNELVSNCDYGDVIVTNDEDGKHLSATVYDDYRIEVSGKEMSNICILSSDEDYHVDQAVIAENIDLSMGNTVLELSGQSITQNDSNVVTNEIYTSTKVSVSSEQLDLVVGQKADIHAALLREDIAIDGDVCWQTDSPSVVRCIDKEDGTCIVEAMLAGTATVYAVAQDSGYYAACTVTVGEHNSHQLSDPIEENRSNPTCTESGGFDSVIYCSVCGIELSRTYTELMALGHDWDDGVITAPVTATTEGVMTYTCLRCGETRTEIIPATGEQPCEHGHAYPDSKKATCTEPGYERMICDDCGEIISATVIPALGHNIVVDPAVAATCTATGLTAGKHCTRCDYKVAQTVVPMIPHTYKNGVCTVCGAKDPNYKPPVTSNPFRDVKSGEFYYTAVLWAVNAEPQVTSGTSATTFSPSATCTRAQVVTFLWRAKGCPEPKSNHNPFRDVKQGEYYYKAVLWAVENNITSGTSVTTFSPNAGCTRAQVVTFLWRTEGEPKPSSRSNPFKDVTGGYYYDAVLWAVEKSITAGTSATTFSPNNTCTRGQIVTFLYRDLAE